MINENAWRSMLIISISLLTIVVLMIVFAVMPQVIADSTSTATPEKAIPAFWVNVSFQILAIIAILWTLVVSIQGRRINKELLVAGGVLPIVLGLFLIDAAIAYENNPDMDTSMWLYRCIGYDVIAGILILIARYFRKKKAHASGTPQRWKERKRFNRNSK